MHPFLRACAVSALVLLALLAVPADAAAQGAIKIGLLADLSGPLAQLGKDLATGTELYLEEIGFRVGGRKIDLIVEDTESNPSAALTKARKLVESDRVHVLTGGIMGSLGYALHPYVDAQGVPTTYPIMASDDLTQRKLAKWVVRTGYTSSQSTHPFGEWVAKQLKYKKVAVLAQDFAFGWESVGGFQRAFEENGGEVIQKIWFPLTTNDFAPFIAQIKRDADAVFALTAGRPALQLVRQYNEAGLKARIPLIGVGTLVDETVLPSMGDEALGILTSFHYSAALPTDANLRFTAAFAKKTGRLASALSEGGYTNARWIAEAIKAVNGNVEDRRGFLEALQKVELPDAPRGPVRLDRNANPIENIYVRKVERVEGRLQNTVIETFRDVSQFWKYNPAEYVKSPLYSRDNPPCRRC